jgi:hypothetical protein
MSTCPECSGPAITIDNHRLKNGDYRRRWACKVCKHRWTEYNGPAPTTGPPPIRLSDEVIGDILICTDSLVKMAKRHGCSPRTVQRIRYGDLHSKVLPHVPRWHGGKPQATAADLPPSIDLQEPFATRRAVQMSCLLCIQYTGNPGNPCGLGHPDPIEEGLGFAVDCSTYLEAS